MCFKDDVLFILILPGLGFSPAKRGAACQHFPRHIVLEDHPEFGVNTRALVILYKAVESMLHSKISLSGDPTNAVCFPTFLVNSTDLQ
jgi:hypothetical protein